MQPLPLYESLDIQAVTGPAIRPGGLTLTQRALTMCDFPTGSSLLDVGCGMGATVAYLGRNLGFRAVGVDASGKLIQQGRETNPGADLVLGRAETLPFANRKFSGVFCECMLSLVSDPGLVLSEIHRVLIPGGHFILADLYIRNPRPDHESPDFSESCCLTGAQSRDVVLETVAKAGFRLLVWEDHSDLLKQLAAQMAWEYGTLEHFYSMIAPAGCNGMVSDHVRRTMPGYFLLVAQKEAIE
jgi:arsenite methyltransferase